MRIVTTIRELRDLLEAQRRADATVGFVPTMGYLHDGHESLIRRAAKDNDAVVTSIFVNPLQFGAGEDLSSYPTDPEGDAARAASAGATLLFAPPVAEMYPQTVVTEVSVPALAGVMEGASRPTHFAGVATVVTKLFAIVGSCRSYFGEKDFQQLAIIRRLAADLSLPVEVIGCPTVRAHDGLALSSRNAYLSTEERAVAPVLRRALTVGAEQILAGVTDHDRVVEAMEEVVAAEPLATLDYVEVADPTSLQPVETCHHGVRLFGALRLGRTRLIDNRPVVEADDMDVPARD